MKKLILFCVAVLTITACKNKNNQTDGGQGRQSSIGLQPERIEIESDLFEKDNKYASIRISIQMADEDDDRTPVAHAINLQLIDEIDREFSSAPYSEDRAINAYNGDSDDTEDIMEHYGEKAFRLLTSTSKKDQAIRFETLSEAEADLALQQTVQYSHDMDMHKSFESDRIIVFDIDASSYYGGAHPNSSTRTLVFDKTDGSQLTEWFTPQAAKSLQPQLRKGLIGYFNSLGQFETVTEANLNDCLQIEGTEIPLPSMSIRPGKNGLTFTYGQYEIACYASGMPTFTIPYDVVRPYLTEKAAQLLPTE